MNKANVISGVICLAFGAFVYWLAQGIPPITLTDNLGGRFFPQLVAILFMIASAGLIVTGLMNIEISGGSVQKPKSGDAADAERRAVGATAVGAAAAGPRFGPGEARLLGFLLVMGAYTLLLPYLGYIPASALVFAALIAIAGERKPIRVAMGAALITALLYVLFAVIFGMKVPRGILF